MKKLAFTSQKPTPLPILIYLDVTRATWFILVRVLEKLFGYRARQRVLGRLGIPTMNDALLRILPSFVVHQLFCAVPREFGNGLHSQLEAPVIAAFTLLETGDCVMDIGAHYGEYTVIAAHKVGENGRVISVEPAPRNLQKVKSVTRLFNNVVFVSAAATQTEGRVKLYIHTQDSLHSICRPSPVHIHVPSTSVDALVDMFSLKRVDLIKIDVEGTELSVLAGSNLTLRNLAPVLIIEVHHHGFFQIASLIKKFEYCVYPLSLTHMIAQRIQRTSHTR